VICAGIHFDMIPSSFLGGTIALDMDFSSLAFYRVSILGSVWDSKFKHWFLEGVCSREHFMSCRLVLVWAAEEGILFVSILFTSLFRSLLVFPLLYLGFGVDFFLFHKVIFYFFIMYFLS
jgi:hypothetical protein